MTPTKYTDLIEALRLWDEQFDPEVGLLRDVVGPLRYHTKLSPGTPIHSTRFSAEYAFGLLESGEPERIARAHQILSCLLGLQDIDSASPTYGLWSWFWEEPLQKMSPPDWNWADFIGSQLAQIFHRSKESLSPELREKTLLSLVHAAHSICRRDVALSYTNIAIMGTYVTVMAGQLAQDDTLLSYGRKRLSELVRSTVKWEGFPEYNSPPYTVITLMELTRMLRDFSDESDRQQVEELHDRAWAEIAMHWHAPSQEWAGPHSRSYATLLQPGVRGFIQRGLGTSVTIMHGPPPPAVQESCLPIHCPEKWHPYFSDLSPNRHHVQKIYTAGMVPLKSHTHLTPLYTIASAERGPFWNQSRSLVAYAPGKQGAVAFAPRFLHDGYDFSSGNLLCRQEANRILAGVCFATDSGDKHPSLDRLKNSRIQASDWRLALEITDPRKECRAEVESDGVFRVHFGPAILSLRIITASFFNLPPQLQITREEDRLTLNLIFYCGDEREFVFQREQETFIGFAVALEEPGNLIDMESISFRNFESSLELTWPKTGTAVMALEIPRFPREEMEIVNFAQQYFNRPMDSVSNR